jgi:hypothetical protein
MADTRPWYRRWMPGKKMVAALVGIGVQLIPNISVDLKDEIRNIVVGFIVGQGIADMGKERALIEKSSVPPGQ